MREGRRNQMLRAFALGLAILLAPALPAAAQNPFAPALTVNESVVTNYDIEQRINFLDALGAAGDLRRLAVEQLVEDRVRVQAAVELGIALPEGAIEAGIEEFAQQRGINLEDVERVLAARQIDRQTLEDFVEAGLMWREVVAARFRARAMPSEADIDAALGQVANAPVEVLELAEIAIPFAEHGEAEALALADRLAADLRRGAISFGAAVERYSRSETAREGGRLPPVPAAQLPPQLRGQLLLMEPGQTTEPFPIAGGVAILRLVSLRLEPPRGLPDMPEIERREGIRQQLFQQRIANFGQGYLQELVGDALIVER
jgi:peptidyl-prolyl cis-trans isomerase SurA